MPIQLDIVTPERQLLAVEVDAVRAPGAEGSFGVLPGHTPFVSVLAPGELTYTVGGKVHHYFVGGGFAEVAEGKVIVLAEEAEPVEDIDVAGAQAALEQAEERLRSLQAEEEAAAVERARVQRAAARLALRKRS